MMRRVHAPDSKDKKERKRLLAPFARLLAKAAHANPLPVCALIVSHVRNLSLMVVQPRYRLSRNVGGRGSFAPLLSLKSQDQR